MLRWILPVFVSGAWENARICLFGGCLGVNAAWFHHSHSIVAGGLEEMS